MATASSDPRLRSTRKATIVSSSRNGIDPSSRAASSCQLLRDPSVPSVVQQAPGAGPIVPRNTSVGTGGAAPQDSNSLKRPRACESCRGLKVKCVQAGEGSDGACKRCAKAGRECVITQPTRKRLKKGDIVAFLEEKVDFLTGLVKTLSGDRAGVGEVLQSIDTLTPELVAAALARNNATGPAMSSASSSAPHPQPPSGLTGLRSRLPDIQGAPASEQQSEGELESADVISRGLIAADQASALFRRYNEQMAPHLPAVVFPTGTAMEDVRESKPILLLAVLAAASWEIPAMGRNLHRELMHILANRLIVQGQKTLELVQTLIVTVIWYFPPDNFEELQFYQLINMAALMARDLELGRGETNLLFPYTWRRHPLRHNPLPDSSSIEARRTWLAVYFLASNVAMAVRRPTVIRWHRFMVECIEILQSSPDAAPTDRYLCYLVQTQQLADRVCTRFLLDDPSEQVDVADREVQAALHCFEREVEAYCRSIPHEDKRPSLMLSIDVLSLYMHEIAMPLNKSGVSVAENKAQALARPIADGLTPAHIDALSACVTATERIMDTFLGLDVLSIRCLPISIFVRVAYAILVYIKIYLCAASPNSEPGLVFGTDRMKVSQYLDSLKEKFGETARDGKSRSASKFLGILGMMQSWSRSADRPPSARHSSRRDSGSLNAVRNGPSWPCSPSNELPQSLSGASRRDECIPRSALGNGPSHIPAAPAHRIWEPPRDQHPYSYGNAPSGSAFTPIMADVSEQLAASSMDGYYGWNTFLADDSFPQAMGLTMFYGPDDTVFDWQTLPMPQNNAPVVGPYINPINNVDGHGN
ncbi:hypothetical protein F5Y17DRAFT_461133 [Xylariaceae sp. FL0594]|nr:hypothetical protein F5Y17DRAFT_461133 [Xylariaceae sp. FL0594]